MLARALEVLLGARAPKAVVRPGAKAAYIEAIFQIPEDFQLPGELAEILEDCGGEISLARRIAAEGRSRAMVDGRTVSLENLRDLADKLVAFCGQHEGRDLVMERVQMQILDGSGDGRGLALHEDYSQKRSLALRAENYYQALLVEQAQDGRQLELARYELEELEQLSPRAGEEDELHQELSKLSNALTGGQSCTGALHILNSDEEGALSLLARSEKLLLDAGGPAMHLAERLSQVQAEIADISSDLQRLAEGWEADPQRQALVEERLSALSSLSRKHGVHADQLPDIQLGLKEQVGSADLGPQRLKKAEQDKQEALANATGAAKKLSAWRKKQAPLLSKKITQSLDELAMQGAQFTIQLDGLKGKDLDRLGSSGMEVVQFELQANPGLPSLPLAQVASGGEISRLMLALIAESRPGEQAILVLDEPDVGLGGNTAHGVARRLQALALESQLLVISHLPQIAAKADQIFCVQKTLGDDSGGPTATHVVSLDTEVQVIDELCRMAGHDPSDQAARKVAHSLRGSDSSDSDTSEP